MERTVPAPKFEELIKAVSCESICEGYVKVTVWIDRKEYIITGSMGTGHGGYECVWGHEIIDLNKYSGALPALDYHAHGLEVDQGKRERGYEGQVTKFGNRRVVFIGEQITFKPSAEGKQSQLF